MPVLLIILLFESAFLLPSIVVGFPVSRPHEVFIDPEHRLEENFDVPCAVSISGQNYLQVWRKAEGRMSEAFDKQDISQDISESAKKQHYTRLDKSRNELPHDFDGVVLFGEIA